MALRASTLWQMRQRRAQSTGTRRRSVQFGESRRSTAVARRWAVLTEDYDAIAGADHVNGQRLPDYLGPRGRAALRRPGRERIIGGAVSSGDIHQRKTRRADLLQYIVRNLLIAVVPCEATSAARPCAHHLACSEANPLGATMSAGGIGADLPSRPANAERSFTASSPPTHLMRRIVSFIVKGTYG